MLWDWAGPSEQLSAGDETALPCHWTAGDKQLCVLVCSRAGSSVPATKIGFELSATIRDDP